MTKPTGKTMSILRRYTRRPVAMAAKVRIPGGPAEPVRITDLAEEGCCIECWGMVFHPGDQILLRPEGLEQLVGEVRWSKGHRFGVKFEKQLYGPVVDHICGQYSPFVTHISAGQRAVLRMVA